MISLYFCRSVSLARFFFLFGIFLLCSCKLQRSMGSSGGGAIEDIIDDESQSDESVDSDDDPVSDEGTGAAESNLIQAVRASSHDGNLPANVLDGDYSTRWSAQGSGEYLEIELKSESTIARVAMSVYLGDARKQAFQISLKSGDSWVQVYQGETSGESLELENFSFTPAETSVLRIYGLGNSVNTWNSLTEVRLYSDPQAGEVNLKPNVDVGSDRSITLPTKELDLVASAQDPNGDTLTYSWSQVSGPGVVVFSNANGKSTSAQFPVAGSYELKFTATDGELSSSDTLTVQVLDYGNSWEQAASPDRALDVESDDVRFSGGTYYQGGKSYAMVTANNHAQANAVWNISTAQSASGERSIFLYVPGDPGFTQKATAMNRFEWRFGYFKQKVDQWYRFNVYFGSRHQNPAWYGTVLNQVKQSGTGYGFYYALYLNKSANPSGPIPLAYRFMEGSKTGGVQSDVTFDSGTVGTGFSFARERWYQVVVNYKISQSGGAYFRVWVDGSQKINLNNRKVGHDGDTGDIRVGSYGRVEEQARELWIDDFYQGDSQVDIGVNLP